MMNQIHIHYNPTDGEIVGFENTLNPTKQPGCEIATVEVPNGEHIIPDRKIHKIDLKTLNLIYKSPDERESVDSILTEAFVTQKIAAELQNTDQYMMPDRPLSKEVRESWVVYRQALRDLSKLPAPERLAAWPTRPNVRNTQ